MRYDDDGHGKGGIETAGACCSYCGGESAPPHNEQMCTTRLLCTYGARILAAPRRVEPDGYGAPQNLQPIKT